MSSTDPQSRSGRIVVGVDGSSNSEEALRWAVGQARVTGEPVDAVISWSVPVDYSIAGAGPLLSFDWEDVAAAVLDDTIRKVVVQRWRTPRCWSSAAGRSAEAVTRRAAVR